jgi:ribosome modulation factor
MAQDFTPREAGALAFLAGEPRSSCPFPSYTGHATNWGAGWIDARNAADDAIQDAEGPDLGGWSPDWEMRAERRAMGLTALD